MTFREVQRGDIVTPNLGWGKLQKRGIQGKQRKAFAWVDILSCRVTGTLARRERKRHNGRWSQ